jgi:hypothetical protein
MCRDCKKQKVGDACWTLARHYDYFHSLRSPGFRVRLLIVVPTSAGSIRFLDPVFPLRKLSVVVAEDHVCPTGVPGRRAAWVIRRWGVWPDRGVEEVLYVV